MQITGRGRSSLAAMGIYFIEKIGGGRLNRDIFLSAYKNSNDNRGIPVSFDSVVRRIRDGKYGLDEKTRTCHILASTDEDAYKKFKEKQLPAVTFAGTFTKRNARGLKKHSGLIVLDIDGLMPSQIPDLLVALAQHPYVVLAFVSPSGMGIKVVVCVDPIPENDLEHKGAYQACLDTFEELQEEFEFEIDTSGKDCSRMCYLAHDPIAIVNANARSIDWDREAWNTAETERLNRFEADAKKSFSGTVDVAALDFIDPNDLDYNQWLSVLTACKVAGLSVAQADAWSRRGGVRYQSGEVETRWNGLGTKKISWGAIVNLAKDNGYTPPASEKRYTIDPDYKHNTSDMDTERTANKNVLMQWLEKTEKEKGKHLLILGSAAGTGKTTATIFTVDGLLYIAKTTEEAKKVFEDLDAAEEDVYLHRARMFNREHKDFDNNNDWETLPLGLGDHQRPCIQPELCNLHAKRLGTTNYVCNAYQCPAFAKCKEEGYLSQAEKERKASKVVYAWNEELICDEIFKGHVKRICTTDDIFALDEVSPLELTQERHLDRETLFDVVDRFRHIHPEIFSVYKKLKELLDIQSTAETAEAFIEALSKWIGSTDQLQAIDTKIERYPIIYEFRNTRPTAPHNQPFEVIVCYKNKEVIVPVVDFETAENTAVFFVKPETPIEVDTYDVRFVSLGFLLKVGLATLEDPPQRHRGMLADIKTFIKENADIQNAPFTFNPKWQSFTFHLKPTLNHRRVIFNSASDPDNLIGEAYRNTDVNLTRHIGTPPPWKTDLVFQVSTGNYMEHQSLVGYIGEGDNKKLHFKPRAEEFIENYILPSIQSGLKVLVVAPKSFNQVEDIGWAATGMDDFIPGVNAILVNHHHAEGRNDFQDFDVVFIFHYEPNHWEIQAAAKRIYRNPETPLDFSREKRKVTQGGVAFEKVIYIDNRVQAVYNRECRERFMQSAMRLRPNIHDDKIVVFLTGEPVDIPVTPIPFRPSDAKHFTGDWRAFKEALQKGDLRTVKERIEAGDSRRKAFYDTEDQRPSKADIAERDAEICRRFYRESQSKNRIATEMNINWHTVDTVLKKQPF